MKNLLKLCSLSLLLSWAARAGDQGDVYAFAVVGQHLRTGNGQGTVALGYCPWNDWGLGIVWDQISSNYNSTLEGRFFFEPFETAVGAGVAARRDKFSDFKYHPLFTASAAYLSALTSSIALKLETKGQFIWEDKGSLFLGLGLRVLY